jgi:hypothetical protein
MSRYGSCHNVNAMAGTANAATFDMRVSGDPERFAQVRIFKQETP